MMKSLLFIFFFLTLFGMLSSFAQAGSPDPDFGGGDGLAITTIFDNFRCEGYCIAVQDDGKIVVSGTTRPASGKDLAFVARYEADGSFDHSFNGNGKIVIDLPGTYCLSRSVLVQSDGKILMVAESADTLEGKVSLFRFLNDGSPDSSFDGDGTVTTSWGSKYLGIKNMTMQPDGKILVAGYAGFGDDLFDSFCVARFLSNGTLDNSFDGDGKVLVRVGESYTNIASLVLQPDGKIIAAGYGVFNGNDEFAVVRFNSNGTLDHSFSGDGIATVPFSTGEDRCQGAVLQPDGKIVLGGYATSSITGYNEFAAARLNGDGTLDNSFHGNGMTMVYVSDYSNGARSILLQPDGKIILGGYSNTGPASGSDIVLVRLNPNGIPDFTFDGDGIYFRVDGADTTSVVYSMAFQPDGKIISTGFIRNNGLNQVYLLRTLTGLTTGTAAIADPVKDLLFYPNPVSDHVFLKYELEGSEWISIALYDLEGKLVQPLMAAAERNPGGHAENLIIKQGLPPGNYFLTVQTRTGVKAVKVTLQ